MVDFTENILTFFLSQDVVYFHQSLPEEWLFFCAFNRKRKVFAAEEKSSLYKRDLLKNHEYSPILFFEGSLSIEIAL